jgi:hypothetical protein
MQSLIEKEKREDEDEDEDEGEGEGQLQVWSYREGSHCLSPAF